MMKKIVYQIYIIGFALAPGNLTFARSVMRTGHGFVTSVLASAFDRYAEDHDGRLAGSWSELEPYANFSVLDKHLASANSPPVCQAYTIFVNGPIVHDARGGQMLAICNRAIDDKTPAGKKCGRYAIFRRSAKFTFEWLSEPDAQKIMDAWLAENYALGLFELKRSPQPNFRRLFGLGAVTVVLIALVTCLAVAICKCRRAN